MGKVLGDSLGDNLGSCILLLLINDNKNNPNVSTGRGDNKFDGPSWECPNTS